MKSGKKEREIVETIQHTGENFIVVFFKALEKGNGDEKIKRSKIGKEMGKRNRWEKRKGNRE